MRRRRRRRTRRRRRREKGRTKRTSHGRRTSLRLPDVLFFGRWMRYLLLQPSGDAA